MKMNLSLPICFLLLAGCSSTPKKVDTIAGNLSAVELKTPVELKLKADPDKKELVMWISRSRSENMQNGQTIQDATEETTFTTESSTKQLERGAIGFNIVTVDKEGKLDLNQIAMPEFSKSLSFVLGANGDVFLAGNKPKNSIFYVSPVSLPNGPVQIGDTWAHNEKWMSQSDGTPMEMSMVSILKGVVACGTDQCADIEMSGDVDVQGGLQNVEFKSHWTGRMLFAINTGTPLWSRTDSLETLNAEKAGTRVQSCLEGTLVKPESLRLAHLSVPKCDVANTPAQVKP